jgi:hypothetical protein
MDSNKGKRGCIAGNEQGRHGKSESATNSRTTGASDVKSKAGTPKQEDDRKEATRLLSAAPSSLKAAADKTGASKQHGNVAATRKEVPIRSHSNGHVQEDKKNNMISSAKKGKSREEAGDKEALPDVRCTRHSCKDGMGTADIVGTSENAAKGGAGKKSSHSQLHKDEIHEGKSTKGRPIGGDKKTGLSQPEVLTVRKGEEDQHKAKAGTGSIKEIQIEAAAGNLKTAAPIATDTGRTSKTKCDENSCTRQDKQHGTLSEPTGSEKHRGSKEKGASHASSSSQKTQRAEPQNGTISQVVNKGKASVTHKGKKETSDKAESEGCTSDMDKPKQIGRVKDVWFTAGSPYIGRRVRRALLNSNGYENGLVLRVCSGMCMQVHGDILMCRNVCA